MRATDAVGAYGERVAEAHLRGLGMVISDRNWRCAGELDIVARDGDVLVFCEVKTRRAPASATRSRRSLRARRRGCAGWPPRGRRRRGAPARRAHRPGRGAAAGPRPGGRRARARGGLTWPWPGPAACWSASTATWSTSRPTSVRACRRTSSVGLPDASLTESRDRGARGAGQQRAALAGHPAGHGQPVAGQPAQARLVVRPGDRGRDPRPRATYRSVRSGRRCWSARAGLDGRVRSVRGVLPSAAAAARAGVRSVVVPAADAAEAALVPGVRVTGVATLCELVARAWGGPARRAGRRPGPARRPRRSGHGCRPGPAAAVSPATCTGRTWPTCSGRRPRATCSRWPRPAGTTC